MSLPSTPTHAASDQSDETLVVRAQGGDLDAFTEVVARWDGRLFNFIARRVGGRLRQMDAEDLTQETFLRAWRSIAEYQPRHRFSTWLFTIAGRLVVDHLRHQRVRADATESLTTAASRRQSNADAATDRLLLPESSESLWNIAREILTAEQHAALWLRYAEDLSPGEVARVLDKNEVAVRVMLFRARQALTPYASELESVNAPLRIAHTAAAGGVA